jgi:hypothetical protein
MAIRFRPDRALAASTETTGVVQHCRGIKGVRPNY